MSLKNILSNVANKVSSNVRVAREKVSVALDRYDVAIQNRAKTREIKRRLDYERASDFLAKDRERQAQEAIIAEARAARFKNSAVGKVVSVARRSYGYLEKSAGKRARFASANKSAIVSTDKRGSNFDSSVLYNNMKR